MSWRYFDLDKIEELRSTLSPIVSGRDLLEALLLLDTACEAAECCIKLDDDHPGWQRRVEREQNRQNRDIARLAAALRTRLKAAGVVWNVPEDTLQRMMSDLQTVEAGARAAATAGQAERTSRGRPSLTWRDELIAAAYSAAKQDEKLGHTLSEILLGYLGKEVENLTTVISSARKRLPVSPYSVRSTR